MLLGLRKEVSSPRCRDSEETRRFYEEFSGLSLAGSLQIEKVNTGCKTSVLYIAYGIDDGLYITFFENLETPFDFK